MVLIFSAIRIAISSPSIAQGPAIRINCLLLLGDILGRSAKPMIEF
jgi:hypothetical protein